MQDRNYKIDNIKGALLFCVVWGHLLQEILYISTAKYIYILIYYFHMPLLCLCSGYLAKFNPKKIKYQFIYIYIIFEPIYWLFNWLIIKDNTIVYKYSVPYWILWYILAIIVWYMTIPLIENIKVAYQYIIIFATLGLGMMAGYDINIGYGFSTSRIIVLYPFFLIGFYAKNKSRGSLYDIFSHKIIKNTAIIIGSIILITYALYLYKICDVFEVRILFNSYSYQELGYAVKDRIIIYIIGIIASGVIWAVIPDRKTVICTVGRKSLTVYLLHGFLVKLTTKYGVQNILSNSYSILLSIIISIIIVVVLSSAAVNKIVNLFINLPFILKYRISGNLLIDSAAYKSKEEEYISSDIDGEEWKDEIINYKDMILEEYYRDEFKW